VVRIGELPSDSTMTVRKLCDTNFALFASPAYLAARPPITSVGDLVSQDGAIFRAGNGQLRPWRVNDCGAIREIEPAAALVVADGHALVDATVQGFGMAQLIDRVAQPFVEAGKLVHVLPKADIPGMPVHALIPAGHRMPSRTRVVLDQIVAYFR
jgi:DNA-binding transcriptional LysR family regulator